MTQQNEQPEAVNLARRRFVIGLGAAGASLSLGLALPVVNPLAHAASAGGTSAAMTPEINAWVVIAADDTVTIRIARSEMGQGTLTGLAQLVAEELECDWNKVTWEFPTPGQNVARERIWRDFSTGGSQGLRGSQQYVREGGAAARIMLIGAAAAQWQVPASECVARNSVITHTPSGRTLTFGAVAAAAARQPVPAQVPLKDPSTWTIAGKPVKRLDTRDKLTGKLVYGADITLPGMLLASIRDCPVLGGKLKSFDAAAVRGMPGVRGVLKVETASGTNGVAVIADTWWQAHTALQALPVEWDLGANAGFDDAKLKALLESGLDAEEAGVGNSNGDVKAALSSATRTVEAVYKVPSQNHAPMEPMNATAVWTPEKCEVWCPTQNGEASLAAASQASGLPIAQCEVYKTILGGGFGRRGGADYVHQVVAIAREFPGKPIKLQWSREEDQMHGYYHPTTMAKMRGSFDAAGKLTGLHLRISGQSILAGLMPQALVNGVDFATFQGLARGGVNPALDQHKFGYDIPNLLIDHAMRNPPIRPGFWRGVNMNQNAIYLECFMDELAQAAGQDPLAFRLAHMGSNPKGAAVLEAVAERAGWASKDGKARGLAVMYAFGSYVAACAEVTVNAAGELKIDRIVAATDCGTAVNPQQIEAQVQGSFVYGLSAALYSEITFADGEVQQRNFDSYPSMRMAQMPKVETILMPSGGFFGGVGEPTIGVAAPAVLNAIFAATGTRIRSLPLRDQKLTA